MTSPEYEGYGIDDPVLAETLIGEQFPDIFTGDLMKELMQEERKLRAGSYDAAHEALRALRSAVGKDNSYHKTYVDVCGLPFDRRVAVQTFTDPVGGPMSRLVVNDEGAHPTDPDLHVVYIKDYFLSSCAKAFSWQETEQTRPETVQGWTVVKDAVGPLLEQRHDYVNFATGRMYTPQIATIGNGAASLIESLERRVRLEEFTAIAVSLGIETYEPGIAVGTKLI
ncbi:MAG: hypothetical protein JWP13_592 [Candidatus Saccharibacteria bacterium]|nr:hypothetical protein [Candidatus Saccharibacteria bacterium]